MSMLALSTICARFRPQGKSMAAMGPVVSPMELIQSGDEHARLKECWPPRVRIRLRYRMPSSITSCNDRAIFVTITILPSQRREYCDSSSRKSRLNCLPKETCEHEGGLMQCPRMTIDWFFSGGIYDNTPMMVLLHAATRIHRAQIPPANLVEMAQVRIQIQSPFLNRPAMRAPRG